MGLISVSLPSDGSTADVSDYNVPITTIVTLVNGNLDNSNIAAGAAINGSKFADASITVTKLVNSGTWGATWATATITPTKTGWASTTKNVWQYTQMGKMVWLYFDISGTSNSTSTNVTLPVAARSISATNNFEGTYGLASDNGSIGGGPRWNIDLSVSATICNFFTSYAGGAWTASGTKQIRGLIIYEAA